MGHWVQWLYFQLDRNWKWVPPCSHLKTLGKSKLGACMHASLVTQSCLILWDLMDWVKPRSPALKVDSSPSEPPGKPTLSASPSSWGILVTQGWGMKPQLSASPFPTYEGQLAALLDKEHLMCLTDGKYTILTLPPNLTNLNLLSILFPQQKDVLKNHLNFHCSFPLISLSLSHIISDTVSRNWNQLTKLTHLPRFLCSSVGKEYAYNAGDRGSILGLGRSPGEGNGNPLQYSCLENPKDRGPGRYALWGCKSQTWLSN